MERSIRTLVACCALTAACGGASPGDTGSGTTAPRPEDPVWVPGIEARGRVPVELTEGTGEDSECLTLRGDPMPWRVFIREIDGSTVVISETLLQGYVHDGPSSTWPDERVPEIAGYRTLYSHTIATSWHLPEPAHRLVVDVGGPYALVVGSRDLDIESIAEVATQVIAGGAVRGGSLDLTGIELPGKAVSHLDTTGSAASNARVISSLWERPGSSEAVAGCGRPMWILTLEDESQFQALERLADPDPDGAVWNEIEPIASVPPQRFDPAETFEVLGVEATSATFTARTQALFIPADPPVVVFGSNSLGNVNEALLVAVGRSLRTVGAAELPAELERITAAVQGRPTTTTMPPELVESTTTSTTTSTILTTTEVPAGP